MDVISAGTCGELSRAVSHRQSFDQSTSSFVSRVASSPIRVKTDAAER